MRRTSSRRALGPALACSFVLLVAFAIGPVPSALAATPPPPTAGGTQRIQIVPTTVTFYGRGYGHGVGLSQYGARGRALAGQSAATILAHYYEGTTPATVSASAPVRILVLAPIKPTAAKPIILHGRGEPFTIDGISGTFPVGAKVAVWPSGTGFAIQVNSSSGTLLRKTTSTAQDIRLRSGADPGRIEVDTKPVADDTYRGVIRLLGASSGVMAINEVGLDLYLRGVVPSEMPSSWPAEALKAQAIAARSYAEEHVHPGTGSYDLFDDTRSQVYRGSLGETTTTNAIVTATAGQVLKSGSAIINALYHSADGGATEDNENVFTSATGQIVAGPASYLRGSSDRDPNGVSYDASSPHASWHTATYTWAQLSAIFDADSRTSVGTLTSLDLSDVGVSGRPIKVVLTGSGGTKTVSSEIFREIFNADSPATDPYMWSTLISTSPIP
ncbi:MAG TPA: SpoIID/LytB domain-containing protein [Candidatus Limnocylindrales bacterium]